MTSAKVFSKFSGQITSLWWTVILRLTSEYYTNLNILAIANIFSAGWKLFCLILPTLVPIPGQIVWQFKLSSSIKNKIIDSFCSKSHLIDHLMSVTFPNWSWVGNGNGFWGNLMSIILTWITQVVIVSCLWHQILRT